MCVNRHYPSILLTTPSLSTFYVPPGVNSQNPVFNLRNEKTIFRFLGFYILTKL